MLSRVATVTASLGVRQGLDLLVALVLASLIGVEREVRQKSAGLRTHTLVGLGAALFMLVSKYGFSDVLVPNQIVADPSRVAAQIVSGIGFLGAGLIFVRRDSVRGLTTAASIWLTAAVGACAGAGLPILSLAAWAMYFFVMVALTPFAHRLPGSRWVPSEVRVRYADGRGLLRDILHEVTEAGFSVADLQTRPCQPDSEVEIALHVYGRGSVSELASRLHELDGVESVGAADANDASE
jgi:putative Mg2+ transporter-C (MgtC) family protein